MNEKFYELPEEKQLRIINAGFKVFGENEYKHASTEQIAENAGISKGLLFYYFHNKKDLYIFLYEYAEKLIGQNVVDSQFWKITDFFELCKYSAIKKYTILQKNPYISEFALRAFYSQKEDVSDDMNKKTQEAIGNAFSAYFKNINFTKFKADINPQDMIQMLLWMADGCLHEQQRAGIPLVLGDLMKKYNQWADMFKKIAYKEEYLK